MAKFTAYMQFGDHVQTVDIDGAKIHHSANGAEVVDERGQTVAYFPAGNLMGVVRSDK